MPPKKTVTKKVQAAPAAEPTPVPVVETPTAVAPAVKKTKKVAAPKAEEVKPASEPAPVVVEEKQEPTPAPKKTKKAVAAPKTEEVTPVPAPVVEAKEESTPAPVTTKKGKKAATTTTTASKTEEITPPAPAVVAEEKPTPVVVNEDKEATATPVTTTQGKKKAIATKKDTKAKSDVVVETKTPEPTAVVPTPVAVVEAKAETKKDNSFAAKATKRQTEKQTNVVVPTPVVSPQTQADADIDSDDEDNTTTTTTNNDNNNNRQAPLRTFKRTEVFLDLQAVPIELGRVIIELFPDCPLAYENFRALCTGEYTDAYNNEPMTYRGSFIDQIEDDYVVFGNLEADDETNPVEDELDESDIEDDAPDLEDDKTMGDGDDKKKKNNKTDINVPKIHYNPNKPAKSIYGGYFPDEQAGLERCHVKAGTVSMFNTRSNKNGTKFMITLKPHMKWLDGQYTVIGQVVDGLKAVHALQSYRGKTEEEKLTAKYKKSKKMQDDDSDEEEEEEEDDEGVTCIISNCGRYKKKSLEKKNPFLQQALATLAQKNEATTAAQQDAQKKIETQKKCPKCGHNQPKYVTRELNKKRVKFWCRAEECKATFYVEDAKYDPIVLEIAAQLAKKAQEQQHHEYLLTTSAAYRKRYLKKCRKEGKDMVAVNAELAAHSAVKDSNLNPVPKKFVSPTIAKDIVEMLSRIVDHKKEKREKFEASKKEHKKYLEGKEKLLEDTEQQLVQLEQEYKNAEKDLRQHVGKQYWEEKMKNDKNDKKRKFNGNDNKDYDHKNNIKQMKNNKKNREEQPTFTEDELSTLDKQTRRTIRKQLGMPSGPSKTPAFNPNKKRLDPKEYKNYRENKKIGGGSDYKKSSNDATTAAPSKRGPNGEKIRWKKQDESQLPKEFVEKIKAKAERNAAKAAAFQ